MALQSSHVPISSVITSKRSMWQKLKDQLPSIVVISLILGLAVLFHQKSITEISNRQQTELASLRDQHAIDLKTAAEETNRRIDAVNILLKDAIQKRSADAFVTEEEMAKVNAEKISQLAEAIATKMQPFNPLPKTPEEAEHLQNEQVDKVSSRMADKIQPILTEMSRDQNLTRTAIASYSQKISDQVGTILTTELAKNQQLNNSLASTQAVARDSLRLSHEITALYLSSFKDQGLITRLLSLPANVIKDASSLSIVNSTERKKMEERYFTQLSEIERRLNETQASTPRK